MATIEQIADAVEHFENNHIGGLDNCMEPVVIEIDAEDGNGGDTVFVTSRLSMGAWPSSRVVFDLSDGETLTEVKGALADGHLLDLLQAWATN